MPHQKPAAPLESYQYFQALNFLGDAGHSTRTNESKPPLPQKPIKEQRHEPLIKVVQRHQKHEEQFNAISNALDYQQPKKNTYSQFRFLESAQSKKEPLPQIITQSADYLVKLKQQEAARQVNLA